MRKIFAVAIFLVAAVMIGYFSVMLYRDATIRRNGEEYSTLAQGMGGSFPWVFIQIDAPPGMVCPRRFSREPGPPDGHYCLNVERAFWNWRDSQFLVQYNIGYDMIDVIYYDGRLLYAHSTERRRYIANLIFAGVLLLAGGLVWKHNRGKL